MNLLHGIFPANCWPNSYLLNLKLSGFQEASSLEISAHSIRYSGIDKLIEIILSLHWGRIKTTPRNMILVLEMKAVSLPINDERVIVVLTGNNKGIHQKTTKFTHNR